MTKEAPDIGSLINFSLHTVHGGFQQDKRESGWKKADKLSPLVHQPNLIYRYNQNINILKNYAHRWMENLAMAEGAAKIVSTITKNLQQYIIGCYTVVKGCWCRRLCGRTLHFIEACRSPSWPEVCPCVTLSYLTVFFHVGHSLLLGFFPSEMCAGTASFPDPTQECNSAGWS